MFRNIRRPLSLALGALATTALGGCTYGDVNSASYASSAYACETRYGSGYYDSYDPYAYDDGYGYGCYDGADYGRGFIQIGFGGGWYDDYYYPGYGMWMYDNYRNRYPLRGQYLNYWGGRRAWWMHRQDRPGTGDDGGKRNWKGRDDSTARPPVTTAPVQPGRTPGAVRPRPPATGEATPGRPGAGDGNIRPGGWNRGDRDGTRPERRPDANAATPPATGNPRAPGTMRPRPPATGEAQPRRSDAARPVINRPAAAERPVRAPSATPPSAPPPRAAPAPAQRPAMTRPERPTAGKRDFRTRNEP